MTRRTRVFVTQDPKHRDRETGQLVSKYDFRSAEEYGGIVFLLSPNAAPWTPDKVIAELHSKLADYTSDDYLVLVGNPALLSWVAAIAAEYSGGVIRQLQWQRWPDAPGGGRYIPLYADIFPKSLGF